VILAARVVVAAVFAVVLIAVTVVADAVVDAVFAISRPGVGRTVGEAGDTGMFPEKCAIWPWTALLGWLPGLKGLVLVFGEDEVPGRRRGG
jgi:hypothetical protein